MKWMLGVNVAIKQNEKDKTQQVLQKTVDWLNELKV
jgi:hypothetical protein